MGFGKIVSGQKKRLSSIAAGQKSGGIFAQLDSDLKDIQGKYAVLDTVIDAGGSLAQGYVQGQEAWGEMEQGASEVGMEKEMEAMKGEAGWFEKKFGPSKGTLDKSLTTTTNVAGVSLKKGYQYSLKGYDVRALGKARQTLGRSSIVWDDKTAPEIPFKESVRRSGWGQYSKVEAPIETAPNMEKAVGVNLEDGSGMKEQGFFKKLYTYHKAKWDEASTIRQNQRWAKSQEGAIAARRATGENLGTGHKTNAQIQAEKNLATLRAKGVEENVHEDPTAARMEERTNRYNEAKDNPAETPAVTNNPKETTTAKPAFQMQKTLTGAIAARKGYTKGMEGYKFHSDLIGQAMSGANDPDIDDWTEQKETYADMYNKWLEQNDMES